MEFTIDSRTLQLLQHTTRYFSERRQQTYLVGGSLRNLLIDEECLDWDIVTPGDAPTIARQLADTLGGHFVHMHEKASRVVVHVEDTGAQTHRKELYFDISPLTGSSIEEDLRHRDFTINAIAAPLDQVVRYLESQPPQPIPQGDREGTPLQFNEQPLQYHEDTDSTNVGAGLAPALGMDFVFASQLIDPLNGLADLQARRLKAVDNQVFRHDPLRMLRAVRIMMRYQLQIDSWTASLISRDAALLSGVAPERVHDELYAILGPDGAANRLHFLDEHGLFMVIFPEFAPTRGMRQPSPHHWDVLTHSIQSVDALEQIALLLQPKTMPPDHNQNVGALFMDTRGDDTSIVDDLAELSLLLQEAEQQGIFSFAGLTAPRMKMATLLHDIGKLVTYSCDQEGAIHFYNHPKAGVPLVEQVMRRLCASTQDRRLAQLIAAHHMRPGQLGQDGPVTPRAIRRYFVDLGPTGIYVALFSLADHLATLGPQPTNESWQRHLGVVRLLLTRYIRERDSILPPRLISPEELMRRLKLEPGPIVGQLLDVISEAQAEGKVHSKEEALWFAEEHLNTL
jgi:tRNA nucleotidyltransferase/poly(A) polymerase